MEELYIKRVLRGDLDAFSFLVRQHQSMALRTALSIVKNEADAKDVVQVSFLQAYESLHTFRLESRFSTWFYRIVVNKSLRQLKKKGVKTDYSDEFSGEVVAHNEGVQALEEADLSRLLKEGLKQLPPKEALCVQFFYLEEYSLAEIVEVTGFSPSNVKVLLHRGRKHLYEHLICEYNSVK
ncbi:MAG: sigma-70 family RNA polymerase sigma factor [Phaeodactylibacter sp.]|nr:sigma-70 family RNA polymerase sigma factor [Phaeodactylibacter sp.]